MFYSSEITTPEQITSSQSSGHGQESVIPRAPRVMQRCRPYQGLPVYNELVQLEPPSGPPSQKHASPVYSLCVVSCDSFDHVPLGSWDGLDAVQRAQQSGRSYISELESEIRESLQEYAWYALHGTWDQLAQYVAGVLRVRRQFSTPWPSRYDVELWNRGTRMLSLLSYAECADAVEAVQGTAPKRSVRVLSATEAGLAENPSKLDRHPLCMLRYDGQLRRGVCVGEARLSVMAESPQESSSSAMPLSAPSSSSVALLSAPSSGTPLVAPSSTMPSSEPSKSCATPLSSPSSRPRAEAVTDDDLEAFVLSAARSAPSSASPSSTSGTALSKPSSFFTTASRPSRAQRRARQRLRAKGAV